MSRLTNTQENRKGTEPFSYWLKDSHPLEQLKAFKKLASYEDKEEQGLLLKLPFKVGDTVYRLTASKNAYYKTRVSRITIYEDSIWVHFFNGKGVSIKEIGKTVFLTEAEAEEVLAKMGE